MHNDNISQTIQQGFRIAVGAITSLVETAQNSEKRSEALSEFQMELNQKAREWAIKGEITEQEARKIIESLLNKNAERDSVDSEPQSSTVHETNINVGLQQLRDELIALRIELAKMRQSKE